MVHFSASVVTLMHFSSPSIGRAGQGGVSGSGGLRRLPSVDAQAAKGTNQILSSPADTRLRSPGEIRKQTSQADALTDFDAHQETRDEPPCENAPAQSHHRISQ